MIIDDDHVESEPIALGESALNSVENRPLAISHRYDYACFYRQCFIRSRDFRELWRQPGAYSFQVCSCDAFHFYLVVTITRIHLIELLLTGRPRIGSRCVVQRLRNSDDGVFFRNPQSQIV